MMRSARRSVACWLSTASIAAAIKGTGVGGRLTREDIDKHLAKAPSEAKAEAKAPAPAARSRHSQLWAHR